MINLPKLIKNKLEKRIEKNELRNFVSHQTTFLDFYSNDYLGFSNCSDIYKRATDLTLKVNININGSTGSRLISGNHILYEKLERKLSIFFDCENALVFNSGYDANIGFFSSVPQRCDLVLYDAFIHTSIRMGLQISNAKSLKFSHHDLSHLENLLEKNTSLYENIYVVTESVFSMDGDQPNIENMINLCNQFNAKLIVDEAHAIGVIGNKGEGLLQKLNLHNKVFARIVTFGKAIGIHGACILCSDDLRLYLINFASSLIYSTALPPHTIASIYSAFEILENKTNKIEILNQNIVFFMSEILKRKIYTMWIKSRSAIQCFVLNSTSKAEYISNQLSKEGIIVKAILSPTVPLGKERIRICLHSTHTQKEILILIKKLEHILFCENI